MLLLPRALAIMSLLRASASFRSIRPRGVGLKCSPETLLSVASRHRCGLQLQRGPRATAAASAGSGSYNERRAVSSECDDHNERWYDLREAARHWLLGTAGTVPRDSLPMLRKRKTWELIPVAISHNPSGGVGDSIAVGGWLLVVAKRGAFSAADAQAVLGLHDHLRTHAYDPTSGRFQLSAAHTLHDAGDCATTRSTSWLGGPHGVGGFEYAPGVGPGFKPYYDDAFLADVRMLRRPPWLLVVQTGGGSGGSCGDGGGGGGDGSSAALVSSPGADYRALASLRAGGLDLWPRHRLEQLAAFGAAGYSMRWSHGARDGTEDGAAVHSAGVDSAQGRIAVGLPRRPLPSSQRPQQEQAGSFLTADGEAWKSSHASSKLVSSALVSSPEEANYQPSTTSPSMATSSISTTATGKRLPLFPISAPYRPTGDQPRAIADLCRGLDAGRRFQASSASMRSVCGRNEQRGELLSHCATYTVPPPPPLLCWHAAVFCRGFRRFLGVQRKTLLGATGTGKTFIMANVIKHAQKPTLVLAPNKVLAAQLFNELRAFFPDSAVEYFISFYDFYLPESYNAARDEYVP